MYPQDEFRTKQLYQKQSFIPVFKDFNSLPLFAHTVLPFVVVPLCPTPTLLDLRVSGSPEIRIKGNKAGEMLTSGFLCGSRTINHVVLQLSSERRAQSCDQPSSRWRAKEHTVTSMVEKEMGLSSASSLSLATSPGPCPGTLHSGCCSRCAEPVVMKDS